MVNGKDTGCQINKLDSTLIFFNETRIQKWKGDSFLELGVIFVNHFDFLGLIFLNENDDHLLPAS